MSVRLLTEHHLEYLSIKGAAQARLRLHLSKGHIVGNHMSQLIYNCTQAGPPVEESESNNLLALKRYDLIICLMVTLNRQTDWTQILTGMIRILTV